MAKKKTNKVINDENATAQTDQSRSDEESPDVEADEAAIAEDMETDADSAEVADKAEHNAAAETLSDLEEELNLTRQEAGQNLENWQRAAAELANFKRRQEEQMKLQRDRIKSEVLEGVLSALDDMDLAFQNLPEELDGQLIGWVEGFRLVQRKLDRILDDQNVMTIDTDGNFDPNFHEAVSYEDSDEHDTDSIIAELRKGYQIGNRVIRPALVRVAK